VRVVVLGIKAPILTRRFYLRASNNKGMGRNISFAAKSGMDEASAPLLPEVFSIKNLNTRGIYIP
jgi:hypothetical protein